MQVNLTERPGWVVGLDCFGFDFQDAQLDPLFIHDLDNVDGCAGTQRYHQKVGRFQPHALIRRREHHRVIGRIDSEELLTTDPVHGGISQPVYSLFIHVRAFFLIP